MSRMPTSDAGSTEPPPRSTRVLRVPADDVDPAELDAAARVLDTGGLVAFPTETVYGLGAVADDPEAVQSVFVAKGRPATDPLIVHGPSIEALEPVVDGWPDRAVALAERFWPGPLTMVLARSDRVDPAVSSGRSTVAVRVPAHPVALALLSAVGRPVAAPSANRFGRISPTTAGHVLDELDGRIDMVVDGGPTPLGVESTVVDLTGPVAELLRPGGVLLEDLEDVLGAVVHTERAVHDEGAAAAAPGRFLRHYAPTTPLVLTEGAHDLPTRLVAAVGERGVTAGVVGLDPDPQRAARSLYGALRDADRSGVALLFVAMVAPEGLGRAVNDRLYRAAHGRVVLDDLPASVERVISVCS